MESEIKVIVASNVEDLTIYLSDLPKGSDVLAYSINQEGIQHVIVRVPKKLI